jgi:ribosomal protein L37E
MVEKQEDIRCKKCGSSQTYVRLKSKERVCHSCSYIEKLEVKR